VPTKPTTLEDYLSKLPADQRFELERLRGLILSAAPQARECISYGLPAFRLEGKILVGMGATRKHCALYLMSSGIVKSLARLLGKYDTSTGTVRFVPGKGLTATLVRKLVKARIAENKAIRERQTKK
jgi:uncharacterized protein YdhG (YjbR/CyaY superfamily)